MSVVQYVDDRPVRVKVLSAVAVAAVAAVAAGVIGGFGLTALSSTH